MSKKILIVESDSALSSSLREALEARGFAVDETTDGKGSVEQIRRDRPDLVVLAVDLSGGQNGYLICGKLKKDDDLKNVPIVIIGNPDGFAAHRKLKAHADEYVAKPVDSDQLVDRVGALIGFPEVVVGEVVEDEGLTLDGLTDDEPMDEPLSQDEPLAEEIAVESEPIASASEDLDMLDEAFSDMAGTDSSTEEEPVVAPPEASGNDEELDALDNLGKDAEDALDSLGDDEEKTQIGFMAPVVPLTPAPIPDPPRTPSRPAMTLPAVPAPSSTSKSTAVSAPAMSAADAAELRNLRAKVAELQSALSDAEAQASTAESRVQELEGKLETQTSELETARSAAGKSDKDSFALKDAVNKKDKELLRLKSEINLKEQEKDKEISRLKGELTQKEHDFVELQDKQLELERQHTESAAEMARRDAQIKTLTTRADQLTADKKKVEVQLTAAKEEARSASSKLTALQAEVDAHQQQQSAVETELEDLRGRVGQLESELETARGEASELRGQAESAREETSELRGQLEAVQSELETAKSDAEMARTELETVRTELETVRTELEGQAATAAEEAEGLRRRISELEEAAVRNEERVTKLYTRIKNDEKLRERAKKALGIAHQLLEEAPSATEEADEAAA
ncbi:response regulator [Hyalangium minutum]|uniref:TolA protein n=1 Tax=Hyalangium minutum TaxID=394096 RepID=A0A085WGR4_9BACT|nr:response regulator [Hyalangium minutum]KFE66877.1 TolA protein [Hyalangium minutum]